MSQVLELLASVPLLALVILGFGFIIFIHELGHFVAAKWAGIRVLAFAVGFGPAAVSYRKGFGWRRGSSEREYLALVDAPAAGMTTVEGTRATYHGISPTEYRLNWLPFGGYVKMLGQEDTNPGAVSEAPDSYQRCPVWKRMIVISAGVVMNVMAAAVLFIAVFLHGIETEAAKIGYVQAGSPGSRAASSDGPTGLRPGDRVLSIDGRKARSFNDILMASAMSRRGVPMELEIERAGRAIAYRVTPETGRVSRLMEIGIAPAFSATLLEAGSEQERAEFARLMEAAGLKGVEAGMRLVRVGANTAIQGAGDLLAAVEQSGGGPVEAEFERAGGERVTVRVRPRAQPQTGFITSPSGAVFPVAHLLGLTPVMCVDPGPGSEPRQGLERGDVFARIGSLEFPSLAAGRPEIHRHRGKQIAVEVLRGGNRMRITPDPTVERIADGQIGFVPGDTWDQSTLVALPLAGITDSAGGQARTWPATDLIRRPGTTVVKVGGAEVGNFSEIRAALREATRSAFESGAGEVQVPILLQQPGTAGGTEEVSWRLSSADLRTLHGLGWESPLALGLFKPEAFVLRASGGGLPSRAVEAVRMGLAETDRVMRMTYLTFVRLFEGTVKVEHLKGPVGIAHMGTDIARRGLIWLLFFMALISVNLAVVNFLPLPIVDGGQFIFLVLEAIRGKPLSIAVQNIATIAGLVLIGTMFLIVTFQDVANLFG